MRLTLENKKPIISILCVAFNHEDFIAQALESFLCQLADFPIEIVVHDDASTDKTSEIIKSYEANYPHRIKYIRQQTNRYSRGEKIFDLALSYATGEFVALCEGDDFWNDPHKIQLQVEYMLANPRCGAVFGDADIFYQNSGITIRAHDFSRNFMPPVGDVRKSLLRGNPYKSCTVMLSKEAASGYAVHATKLHSKMEDYVLWLHVATRFDIGYIPVVLATYRILQSSASHSSGTSGKIRFEKSAYKVAIYFNKLMGNLLNKKSIKANYSYSLFSFFVSTGRLGGSISYIQCSLEFWSLLYFGLVRKLFVIKRKIFNETA